jgi:hypothetical protein
MYPEQRQGKNDPPLPHLNPAILLRKCASVRAYVAYRKGGGSVEEMKRKVEDLGMTTESLRKKTTDVLENLEKKIRGEEKKSEGQPGDKGSSQ